MKKKNNISETPLEKISFLSGNDKLNDFKVPQNYFKSLDKVMLNKSLENNMLKNIIDKMSYSVSLPILASLTVLISLFFYNQKELTTTITSNEINSVLLNENLLNIDEELLIETYSEILKEELYSETDQEKENEEYINYLLENDIDISTIMNEL